MKSEKSCFSCHSYSENEMMILTAVSLFFFAKNKEEIGPV